MTEPTFSVVIPTYNHADFLKEALTSLVSQTCPAWEAIIVNNYSEDNTVAVVEGFADSRIRLENFHNHGIIAASRNRGIALAQGRFVAFLDSDDLWYPEKLERCLARLKDGYDFICHGECWYGDDVNREVFYGPEARATYSKLLFEGNCISTSATIVRRENIEAVGGFCEDPAMVTVEDYDLWLRLIHSGAKISFIREILGKYRIHAGGQSRAILRNMNATMYVVQQHVATLKEEGYFHWLRIARRKAIVYYCGARGLQGVHRHKEAWSLLFRSLCAWPFWPKLYAAILLNVMAVLGIKPKVL
jgi:glycosyltransferase involved in cell wall biosynthesis